MQIQQFKKRLIIEGSIYLTVIVVLSAGAYFLTGASSDYAETNNGIRNKIKTIETEFTSLQEKFNFVMQNADLYKEVQKKQSGISRQIMFEKFNQFRSQFDLSDLRLSVSPVQDMSDPKYKKSTSVVRLSNVTVELESLYDENVFELLNAMQRELSGICVFSRLQMSMEKPLDAGVLQAIGTKGTYPLIKAAIRFNWYSINSLDTNDAGNATK